MIIVQDSREQKMLDFSGMEGVEKVETMALKYGDYNAILNGSPAPLFFERKGLSDLFGTMTSGYERYKKEMERAKTDGVKLILIIEGSYSDVWQGFERSAYSGQAMLKKLAMLYVRYDHEYIFCESRRVMARRIYDVYSAIERNYSKKNPSNISATEVSSTIPLKESQASWGGKSLPNGDL